MEDILILTQQKTDSPNFIRRFVYAMSSSAKVVDQGWGGHGPFGPPRSATGILEKITKALADLGGHTQRAAP